MFEELGVQVLGASFDSPEENRRFRERKNFPFPLLCDTGRELGLAYGACSDRSARYPDRITYLIDEEGRVSRVWPKVSVQSHADDVLRALGADPPRRGLFARLFGRK